MLLLTVFYLILGSFILLHSFALSFDLDLNQTSHTNTKQIACTLALLEKYFQSGEPLSGSVLTMSFTAASLNIQQDLLSAIYAQEHMPWSLVVRQPRSHLHSYNKDQSSSTTTILHEKPQLYFLVVDNIEEGDLDVVYADWKKNVNWNPIAQFVVYLTIMEETDEDMNDLMVDIMLNFMNNKVFNINVIGRYRGSEYLLGKTVFPYHPDNNCGSRVIKIETLDICYFEATDSGNEGEVRNQEGDGDGDDDNDNGGNEDANGIEEGDGDGGGDGHEPNKYAARDRYGYRKDAERKRYGDGDGDNSHDGDHSLDGDLNRDRNVSGNQDDDINDTEDGDDQENEGEVGDISNGGRDYRKNYEGGSREVPRDLRAVQNRNGNEYDEGAGDKEDHRNSSDSEIPRNLSGNKDEDISGMQRDGNALRRRNKDAFVSSDEKTAEHAAKDRNEEGNLNGNGNEYGNEDMEAAKDKSTDESNKTKKEENEKIRTHNEESNNKSQNNTANTHSKIQLQELRRGLFIDKVPKDLSGCAIIAGYRPWEPYIFKENSDEATENRKAAEQPEAKDEKPINFKKDYVEDANHNYVYEYVYSAGDDDDSNYSNASINANDSDAYYNLDEKAASVSVSGVDVDAESKQMKSKAKLNGIEYQLIQTIGELLHVTVEMKVENGNLYLLFQQLLDGEVEMIFGGIDEDPSISQFVSSAIPYHQDDLTWCVAKAKRNYQLFNIFQTFHTSTWMLIITLVAIISLNVCIAQQLLKLRLSHFRSFVTANLRVFGIILSQSTQLLRLPNSLRILFIFTCFFSLMFVNFYESFLVSTLTTPKSAYQISHLAELYHNRMLVTGSVENVRHFNKDGEIFKYIRENFQMCYNIEQCLNNAATDEQIAVAVSRQHSFYNPRIQRDHLYCFDRNENIYIYLVTMLMPKKYHFLHKINPVIQHVIESGHMEKWARELDMKRKIRELIRQAQIVPVKELTIQQIVGVFAVHCMALAVALLVFLLERCTHWLVVKRRTRLRLVRLLHRKFYQI